MARSTSLLVRCETHVRMCRIQQSNINFLNSRRDVIQCTALSSYYSTVRSRTYDTIMYWACGASTLSVQPHNLRRRLCDYWGLCFDAQRMLRRRTVGSCRRAACSCAYCNTEHLTAQRHARTYSDILSVTLTVEILTTKFHYLLRPVYSDATQLNSTRRRVELS